MNPESGMLLDSEPYIISHIHFENGPSRTVNNFTIELDVWSGAHINIVFMLVKVLQLERHHT